MTEKTIDDKEKWLNSMKERYSYMLQPLSYAEVGKGWFSLLEELFEEIDRREKVIESQGKRIITSDEAAKISVDDYDQVYEKLQFVQIKEKFGSLRAYAESGSFDPGIRHLIDKAESQSFKTCEECGTVETTKQRNVRGWIHTFCQTCNDNCIDRKAKELQGKQ